ncbi:MAG TPA: type II toxin-antitoxin system PemK/MazF family toxin [Pyrinomonadaceae bacterium]|nr:type II toxin-antitoxin system PemK/MazF family toxin [Pyrinomonadaceae bacterium]
MTHCKRGEIVLVLYPDSNLRTAKRRPALVIQADNLNTGLRQTIVAMITSNMSRADHVSRVRLLLDSPAGQKSGILMDSVVMTDNLATVHENEIDRALGKLEDLAAIDAAIRQTLALN